MPAKKPAKRTFRVYASDAAAKKGKVISKCHATYPFRCAKRFAFRGKTKSAANAYVVVEELKPGRGENPAWHYKLSRKWVRASPEYKKIAEARGYKNVTTEPKVKIEKRQVLVPSKRSVSKPKRKAPAKRRAVSKPKRKTAAKRRAGSKPKKAGKKGRASSKPKRKAARKVK